MTRTARLAGVLAGALLALGLTAPVAGAQPRSDESFQFTCVDPAAADTADEPSRHPSGKDRTAESGNSWPQGRSNSDPDGTSNGGSDKPECKRGFPYDEDGDSDGNNGCGNDDDFEDDNNGNCGGKRQAEPVDDGPVASFGAPDEPAEEPAPADEPAPVVKEPAPDVSEPAPAVDDPAPAVEEEEVEGPIVWADEDDSDDPDPDDEYNSNDTDDTPLTTEAPADPTGSPDMELAAHRDLARSGGLLALGLLAAGAVLFGSGRRALAVARRR
jgi:hypothetical protein